MKYYKGELTTFWIDEQEQQWVETAMFYIESKNKLREDDLYLYYNDEIEKLLKEDANKLGSGDVYSDDSEIYFFEEISKKTFDKVKTDKKNFIFKFEETKNKKEIKTETKAEETKNKKEIKIEKVTEKTIEKSVEVKSDNEKIEETNDSLYDKLCFYI